MSVTSCSCLSGVVFSRRKKKISVALFVHSFVTVEKENSSSSLLPLSFSSVSLRGQIVCMHIVCAVGKVVKDTSVCLLCS